MRRWTEGVLALAVVIAFGLGMSLYAGERSPGEGPDTSSPVEADPAAADRGETVANSFGCLVCHTVDGSSGTGPTFKGLAGSDRPLTTGGFVTADDDYLYNSIVDPGSQIVSGFDNVMPAEFDAMLTEAEIDDLIAFIKSLS